MDSGSSGSLRVNAAASPAETSGRGSPSWGLEASRSAVGVKALAATTRRQRTAVTRHRLWSRGKLRRVSASDGMARKRRHLFRSGNGLDEVGSHPAPASRGGGVSSDIPCRTAKAALPGCARSASAGMSTLLQGASAGGKPNGMRRAAMPGCSRAATPKPWAKTRSTRPRSLTSGPSPPKVEGGEQAPGPGQGRCDALPDLREETPRVRESGASADLKPDGPHDWQQGATDLQSMCGASRRSREKRQGRNRIGSVAAPDRRGAPKPPCCGRDRRKPGSDRGGMPTPVGTSTGRGWRASGVDAQAHADGEAKSLTNPMRGVWRRLQPRRHPRLLVGSGDGVEPGGPELDALERGGRDDRCAVTNAPARTGRASERVRSQGISGLEAAGDATHPSRSPSGPRATRAAGALFGTTTFGGLSEAARGAGDGAV